MSDMRKFDVNAAYDRMLESAGCKDFNELARILGISAGAYIELAKKKKSLPNNWLIKLFDMLGCNPSYIRYGTLPKYFKKEDHGESIFCTQRKYINSMKEFLFHMIKPQENYNCIVPDTLLLFPSYPNGSILDTDHIKLLLSTDDIKDVLTDHAIYVIKIRLYPDRHIFAFVKDNGNISLTNVLAKTINRPQRYADCKNGSIIISHQDDHGRKLFHADIFLDPYEEITKK